MEEDRCDFVESIYTFNKNKFAHIIKNISTTYNNQREFAKKSEINRTYLSLYMNMKLDEPPKPKILKKLAKASNGITTYEELMQICGYYKDSNLKDLEVNMDKLKEDEMIIKISEYEEMKEQIAKFKEHQEFDTKIRNNLREENMTLNKENSNLKKENIALKKGILKFVILFGGMTND